MKINVTRIGGSDRYATAKAVAEVNGLGDRRHGLLGRRRPAVHCP